MRSIQALLNALSGGDGGHQPEPPVRGAIVPTGGLVYPDGGFVPVVSPTVFVPTDPTGGVIAGDVVKPGVPGVAPN